MPGSPILSMLDTCVTYFLWQWQESMPYLGLFWVLCCWKLHKWFVVSVQLEKGKKSKLEIVMENHNLQRAVEGIIAEESTSSFNISVLERFVLLLPHGIRDMRDKTKVMDIPGFSWQSRRAGKLSTGVHVSPTSNFLPWEIQCFPASSYAQFITGVFTWG